MEEPLKILTREAEKPYVRIRGIYSTALTKIFLDNGYEIVQPSQEIMERFNLENKILSPHIDIKDLENKQGVLIETFPKFKDAIVKLFFETLEDIAIRYEKFQIGSIYKGVIYRPAPWGGYIVKLTPNMEGYLPENELEGRSFAIGDTILVEVKKTRSNHGYPLLSTKVSVPGDIAVLIPEETVRISHKIKGPIRSKLLEIGQIIRPDGWGIIWRTSAIYADMDELKEEIDRLLEEANKMGEYALKAPALTKLREGLDNLEIEFPLSAKKKLDKIRAEVIPTVNGHHWLKSYSNSLTEIVDFAEKVLANKVEINVLNEGILEYVKKTRFPKIGDLIKIHHIKISGREIILGPARLAYIKNGDSNQPLLAMFRRFKPGGYYDGIDAPKEVGDYGITIAKIEDEKLVTVYYDVNDKLKGIYVNINTPIEAYGHHLRYIDLEVDVVVNVNGEIKVLDTQKLKEFKENKNISEKLFNKVMEKAEEYKEWLSTTGIQEIMDLCSEVKESLAEEEEEDEFEEEFM